MALTALEHERRMGRKPGGEPAGLPAGPVRRCPSCGAGLQKADCTGDRCFTCRAPEPWCKVHYARIRPTTDGLCRDAMSGKSNGTPGGR